VSLMAVGPVAGRAPIFRGPARSRVGRWAVGLAEAVVAVIAVSYTIFFVTVAAGGSVDDTWVGSLGGFALIGGLLVSFVAFVLAVFAKVKRERWGLLWLPLSVFPALLAIVVIAEAFFMD
jgi:hypothetical protein